MSVFNEAVRRRGQAEEDMFFAKLDLELIAELHKKHDHEQLSSNRSSMNQDPNDIIYPDIK
ncbi:hypothetical protein FR932_06090 [Moritella marina ATCC 15381]|uniref:Uncharacterized protein n=1 Tax=Moritella marina ATCC 15381 TaxID=1202962 RepID=A0A5J6WJP7_MORMI|nr:hypothetical protein [Moritella marina]QFI37431.1 hypothetical protein FR932_06090 [Moritella marina ATCC 15381]